jgi:hypothetical protein
VISATQSTPLIARCALVLVLCVGTKVYAQSNDPDDDSAKKTRYTDKVAHFCLSGLGVAASIKIIQGADEPRFRITWANRIVSSIIGIGLGYAKETYDARINHTDKIDSSDMEANIYGVLVGNLVQWQYDIDPK